MLAHAQTVCTRLCFPPTHKLKEPGSRLNNDEMVTSSMNTPDRFYTNLPHLFVGQANRTDPELSTESLWHRDEPMWDDREEISEHQESISEGVAFVTSCHICFLPFSIEDSISNHKLLTLSPQGLYITAGMVREITWHFCFQPLKYNLQIWIFLLSCLQFLFWPMWWPDVVIGGGDSRHGQRVVTIFITSSWKSISIGMEDSLAVFNNKLKFSESL